MRRAFTLIELLIVVAIIAILLSILLPALQSAKEKARRIACAGNLKVTGSALNFYATEYKGNYPILYESHWPHDVSFYTADYIIKQGATRDAFFCPSRRKYSEAIGGGKDDPRFWQYTLQSNNVTGPWPWLDETNVDKYRNYRVTHYFWLMDVEQDDLPGREWEIAGYPQKGWVRKVNAYRRKQGHGLEPLKYPETFELITEATYSEQPNVESANYGSIHTDFWNKWQIPHRTNHLAPGGRPAGGNIFFVDGHASWRPFEQMWPDKNRPQEPRSLDWDRSPYFWW